MRFRHDNAECKQLFSKKFNECLDVRLDFFDDTSGGRKILKIQSNGRQLVDQATRDRFVKFAAVRRALGVAWIASGMDDIGPISFFVCAGPIEIGEAASSTDGCRPSGPTADVL
jgi:hypothetical protein